MSSQSDGPYRANESVIRIDKGELFTRAIDEALAKERALKQRAAPMPPDISPLRALLNNSLFYLPIAATLGALATWALLEPNIHDMSGVAGDVTLVNRDPFVVKKGTVSVTIGSKEVYIIPGVTRFERGPDGQAAFASVDDLKPGVMAEAAGVAESTTHLSAIAIRPTTEARARKVGTHVDEGVGWALVLLFPLAGTLIALGLLLAEGITTRNWARMLERSFLGSLFALLFTFLSFLPAGIFMLIGQAAMKSAAEDMGVVSVMSAPAGILLTYVAARSGAWACVGAALGLGMNLVRSTRAQLRNSVLGGALGGALGGMLFDPIDRVVHRFDSFATAGTSRLVGLILVGLAIGTFVALVERLAREAWLRVRTGPLAGKSFVLYKTPTTLGSSPQSDIYLFKDAEIDGEHAAIHRVGTIYEIEDLGSRAGTNVGGQAVRRRRLASGDQIVLGSTVLEFEERAKRTGA